MNSQLSEPFAKILNSIYNAQTGGEKQNEPETNNQRNDKTGERIMEQNDKP